MPIESKTEDVGKAHPRIVEAVETMIKKGKWTVPGMLKLFLFGFNFQYSLPQAIKRSLATSTSCNYWRSVEVLNDAYHLAVIVVDYANSSGDHLKIDQKQTAG
jgi:hypothetical protein